MENKSNKSLGFEEILPANDRLDEELMLIRGGGVPIVPPPGGCSNGAGCSNGSGCGNGITSEITAW